ncbi:hypothetical protein GCM10010495_07670 [Kitasatospora herbaricolor]|uniref:hypothetical protein n=1 Tax=Kitasatospora herbaricolor TaxID=68217 RepID=UPI00174E88C0|nr:hypothetical protein [Kitasatospora herbaricolor]MDQ0309795.1 hypothetical protein [Kitasatospora herbaricolor]GGU99557.1 hypothetical protein GCM10010495_07670 [Kitasatospora herbaricolor]
MNGGPAVVRRRSAVAALVAAAALGLATGRFVLPPPPGATAHPVTRAGAAVGGPPPGASVLPTPGASGPTSAPTSSASGSASPTGATGPVTTANLLGPAAFGPDVGTGRIHVTDRYGDGAYANSACSGEKTLGQTLGGPGAHFRGLMTSPRTDPSDPTLAADIVTQVAREVAAEATSPSLAQNYAERLLLEEVPCQEMPPGHWVYGRTTRLQLAPDVTASWMGAYEGTLNTTGTAPEGREPCGGIAVLRSGKHYGVLEVHACLGTAAMDRVVRTALSQL